MGQNMEKLPSNIYSWALLKYSNHNERFNDHKKIDMGNVLTIIDRGEQSFKDMNPNFEGDLEKGILKNQVWRLKKYFKMVRNWEIQFDLTDDQSFYDYDLLPEGHPFKRGT